MVKSSFSHVDVWVFDLDNTLYPPDVALFDQIEVLMTDFVQRALNVPRAEADRLRDLYWQLHGTTLAGLMAEHNVDPEAFMHAVHAIDFSVLSADPALARAITALPGRKIVYTNGSEPYANEVLKGCGLDGLFDAIYGVEHASYLPKPDARAFELVFNRDGLDPRKAAMFEDSTRNLEVPHQLGMRTVHVAPVAEEQDFIHHHTDDLTAFLSQLV